MLSNNKYPAKFNFINLLLFESSILIWKESHWVKKWYAYVIGYEDKICKVRLQYFHRRMLREAVTKLFRRFTSVNIENAGSRMCCPRERCAPGCPLGQSVQCVAAHGQGHSGAKTLIRCKLCSWSSSTPKSKFPLTKIYIQLYKTLKNVNHQFCY